MAKIRDSIIRWGLCATGCYFLFLIAYRFYRETRYVYRGSGKFLIPLLITAGIVCFAYLISRYILQRHAFRRPFSEAILLGCVLAATVLPRIILFFTVEVTPVSDYQWYAQSAKTFAETGVYPVSGYMIAITPNALLYVSALAFVFKIFGASVLAGQLLNLLFFTVAVVFFTKRSGSLPE